MLVCQVVGKGRRGHALPIGQATAVALGRYLRARATDLRANLLALWLAEDGGETDLMRIMGWRSPTNAAAVASRHAPSGVAIAATTGAKIS